MRRALVVVLLLLVAAVPLAAQSLTGTITGVVKDEQGGVLPGVTVTLTGKTGDPHHHHRRRGQLPFRRSRPRHLLRAPPRSPDSARSARTTWSSP